MPAACHRGFHGFPTPLPPTHTLLCRHRDESPELASALQGVTSVKLFLAGERVQAIPVIEALVKEAAARGYGVLLPSRDGLGLDGNPAAAQPL